VVKPRSSWITGPRSASPAPPAVFALNLVSIISSCLFG
jgi:hypothetical protein